MALTTLVRDAAAGHNDAAAHIADAVVPARAPPKAAWRKSPRTRNNRSS